MAFSDEFEVSLDVEENIVVIDADKTIEEVQENIRKVVKEKLEMIRKD